MKHGLLFKLLMVLLGPWIKRVRTLTGDYHELKKLQERGQIVFVSQVNSLIDFMIMNYKLQAHGFEPLRFTHGFNPFLLKPVAEAFGLYRRFFFRTPSECDELDRKQLFKDMAEGGNGYIFLKRARWFSSGMDYHNGYFGGMSSLRDKEGHNIFLVPTSVFLTRLRKKGTNRTYFEIFFGTYDLPGRLRKLYQLLFDAQKGGVILSKHINLRVEQERHPNMPEASIEKRLRWTLLFHLNNEDRAYRGPTKRSKAQKVRKILKEKHLTEELVKLAERTGRPFESVQREAARNLNDIASDTSERVINLMRMLFDYVWSRTLEGIDVRQQDLDAIRELTKQGPVVYLPCHRSHVDYLSVAHLFETQGLNYPRIAAGDNLAKWPLGPILRRCGAFFLRRSFKGEAIFPLVFEAYLRHVLRERHVLLFFPEGGRSRTGKLLHPKLGMLGMLLEAWRQGVVDELPLVPVTIDYGKVFEGDSYLREKSGLPKQKENLASVLRSRKVLRHKHGVMRLRFDEPIYLSKYVEAAGLTRETIGFKSKVPLLHALSYEVLNRINSRVTLTAGNIVAGLLLGSPRRGMTHNLLSQLFFISVRHFKHIKVELAFPEKRLGQALENALATFEESESLVRLSVGGEVVVNIPEAKRAEMEYYKNNGLHFILDMCLLSMCYRFLEPARRTLPEIHTLAVEVYEFLHHEFLIQGPFPGIHCLEGCLKSLIQIQAFQVDETGLITLGTSEPGRELVGINAHMLQNFLESYFVVAEVISELADDTQIEEKALQKQCLTKGRLLYAVGTLSRIESVNHITFGNALVAYSKSGFIKMRTAKGDKHPMVSINPQKREPFIELKNKVHQWMLKLS